MNGTHVWDRVQNRGNFSHVLTARGLDLEPSRGTGAERPGTSLGAGARPATAAAPVGAAAAGAPGDVPLPLGAAEGSVRGRGDERLPPAGQGPDGQPHQPAHRHPPQGREAPARSATGRDGHARQRLPGRADRRALDGRGRVPRRRRAPAVAAAAGAARGRSELREPGGGGEPRHPRPGRARRVAAAGRGAPGRRGPRGPQRGGVHPQQGLRPCPPSSTAASTTTVSPRSPCAS
jgi:hypothetical protein